jgi:hypothetical protein
MLIPKADRKLIHELVLPQPPLEQRIIRALETRIHRDVHLILSCSWPPSSPAILPLNKTAC